MTEFSSTFSSTRGGHQQKICAFASRVFPNGNFNGLRDVEIYHRITTGMKAEGYLDREIPHGSSFKRWKRDQMLKRVVSPNSAEPNEPSEPSIAE